MQIEQVTVNGIKVNVPESSAEKQFDLYEAIASRILHQCAATLTEDVTPDLVKGVLMSSEKGFTSSIAELVLSQAVINGTDKIIELKDFQGKIDAYYSLVAEAVCLNLSDFFTCVKSQITSMKKAREQAQQEANERL